MIFDKDRKNQFMHFSWSRGATFHESTRIPCTVFWNILNAENIQSMGIHKIWIKSNLGVSYENLWLLKESHYDKRILYLLTEHYWQTFLMIKALTIYSNERRILPFNKVLTVNSIWGVAPPTLTEKKNREKNGKCN